MALSQFTFLPFPYTKTKLLLSHTRTSSYCTNTFTSFSPKIQCINASNTTNNHVHSPSHDSHSHANAIIRRSAHFQPTIWHYDYIQSLSSKYNEESYAERCQVLREEVRMMLYKKEEEESLHQLELIDVLQRLGVAYHFETEINNILENHYDNIINMDKLKCEKDLHATSLEFRLLRQHGYHLSTDVFDRFLDEMDNFKEMLSVDIKGMLSLYEASFLEVEDESILEKGRELSIEIMKEYVRNEKKNEMTVLINHALELPLHWRMQRWEAIWFIKAYETSANMIPSLLQLAKLDFNMVQAIHLEELKHTSRWWQRLGITRKLSFARDRLVEGFFWSQGLNYKPNLGYFRRVMTQVISFIAILDDMYDVYGTLEELELFTEAVERWDINSIDNLPDYMKISFLGLFNFVNELAFDILKGRDHHIHSYLRKVWRDLCKAYMIEARWYYSGYKPRVEEYLENAWLSISAPVMLVHSYFLIPDPITNQDLDLLKQYPNLLRLSSMVFRLADDLGTSKREMETGDVPKAIECYMNEHEGCEEEEASAHVTSLISTTWKKMNDEAMNSGFSQNFRDMCVNLARTSLWCYHRGADGYSDQNPHSNTNILSSILMDSISIY